jgi:hypothetical protein
VDHTRLRELKFCTYNKKEKFHPTGSWEGTLLDESSRTKHVKIIKFKPISRKLVVEL